MRFAPCEYGLQKMAFVSRFLWAWCGELVAHKSLARPAGPSQTSPTLFCQGTLTGPLILSQTSRRGWLVPLWRRNDLIRALSDEVSVSALAGGAKEKGCVCGAQRVQLEPHASRPWTGTAPLTAVMLPSRDLAGVFCSLTPPPPTYMG